MVTRKQRREWGNHPKSIRWSQPLIFRNELRQEEGGLLGWEEKNAVFFSVCIYLALGQGICMPI